MIVEPLLRYINKFKNLRTDRAHHGSAPHKPILLLSLIKAFQKGVIHDKRIYITPELVALFKTNWNLLVTSHYYCQFALPFYHLKSDGFWSLIPKPGFENILQFKSSMRSFSNLNAAVDFAMIDDDLCNLLKNQKNRNILQQFLLDEYFPKKEKEFSNSLSEQEKLFIDIEDKILNESPEEYRKEIKKLLSEQNDEEVYIRGSLFKREIPRIYNNTCCISGMRIDATVEVSMVDACHIIPFCESYNDTVTNGIALCPNLHRAFDRGLITIDKEYNVIVSKTFREEESYYSIHQFHNKEIILPKQKEYHPLQENISWHREKIFKK